MRSLEKRILLGAGILFFSCHGGINTNQNDSIDSTRAINNKKTTLQREASDFLTKAVSSGILEVQAGQMAQLRGVNPRVRDFGAMMIRDYSKATEEMWVLGKQTGMALPETPSVDYQKHLQELNKQEGTDFDKAYMELMQVLQKADINQYTAAGKQIIDPAISSYARRTLPLFSVHLDSVRAIRQVVE